MLCLLYRQRISTGCTREELGSALWYLCEKQWAKFGDLTDHSITAEGFDVVESKLEDRLELRPFATVRYYGRPTQSELEIGPVVA